MHSNETLVEAGDLDALTGAVDTLCHDGSWDLVIDLRDRCRAALARGKQLWPAAAYAEYRVALDAPGPIAARVAGSAAERFAFGPFAEILASTHRYDDLHGWLPPGPDGLAVAHECVVRGEDLRAYYPSAVDADPYGLPFVRASWEPDYTAPVYEPSRVRADSPRQPRFGSVVEGSPSARRLTSEADTETALRDLVGAWVSQSNGHSEAAAVEGTASDAIAALGCRRHRIASLSATEALDWMVWAAASGGAHGRRRGLAAGRHSALWALLNIAGFAEPDLVVTDGVLEELGHVLPELRFFLWDDGAPSTGWNLRLAVEDPPEGIAVAISANDVRL